MKINLKNSIALRLLRMVFGCYLIVTIVVTSSQLYLEYAQIEKDTLTEVFNVANSFEEGVGAALWSFDQDSMSAILQGMQKIQIIEGIKVTQKNGNIEGAAGTSIQADTNIIFSQTLSDKDKEIRMIKINGRNGTRVLYEYQHHVFFTPEIDEDPQSVGYIYLYTDRNTIINRVKNSFTLILANALVKTFALWLIFLFFSQRMIAQPLNIMTDATQKMTQSHKEKSDALEYLAQSKNKDELYLLSTNFLSMQISIQDEIEHLSALNELALTLLQEKNRQTLYKNITHILQQYVGNGWVVVFNKDDQVCWHSSHEISQNTFTLQAQASFHEADHVTITKQNNIVTYHHHTPNKTNQPHLEVDIPFLYLPLTGFLDHEKNQAIWFFGELNTGFLKANHQLKPEAMNFLQMIANLANGALMNMEKHEIIEDQKSTLEKRVQARTQALADANKELQYMAVHDPLTQLPNRTLFQDRMEHAIATSTREKYRFAVCCIDLTQFKSINDTYGHDVGDKVLIEVSKRFKHALRKSDTLARMGGDEFAILLEDIKSTSDVDVVMRHLADTLEDSIVLSDQLSILASANIGIALFPEHAVNGGILYKYADIAMYKAKRSNANYKLFDNVVNAEEQEQLQFLYELEKGIEQGQLRLHYQPIIDLKTRKPIGLEALVRWQHPERGLIPPNDFIFHAERTALIEPLTHWVVKEACRQYLIWQQQGLEVRISINLSRRVFSFPDLDKKLLNTLKTFELDPTCLKIEITETAAMANPEKAIETAHKLKNLGFSLSIDDFGTGQSSLSHLTQLPVAELKIDRSFILHNNPANLIVIQTVIDLAQALKLDIVAEGVEDEETLQMLEEKGCTAAQGYHICRPNDANTIEAWLKQALNPDG